MANRSEEIPSERKGLLLLSRAYIYVYLSIFLTDQISVKNESYKNRASGPPITNLTLII